MRKSFACFEKAIASMRVKLENCKTLSKNKASSIRKLVFEVLVQRRLQKISNKAKVAQINCKIALRVKK